MMLYADDDPIAWAGDLYAPDELVRRIGSEKLIDLLVEHWLKSRRPPGSGLTALAAFSVFEAGRERIYMETRPGDRTDIWAAPEPEAEAGL